MTVVVAVETRDQCPGVAVGIHVDCDRLGGPGRGVGEREGLGPTRAVGIQPRLHVLIAEEHWVATRCRRRPAKRSRRSAALVCEFVSMSLALGLVVVLDGPFPARSM